MTREQRIIDILTTRLTPQSLQVINQTAQHHVPEGQETHFKVIVVSDTWLHKSKVARHRLVNHLLEAEFKSGLHALSLHLYTLKEWETQSQTEVIKSPPCRGGFTH